MGLSKNKVILNILFLVFFNISILGQATSYDWTEKIQLYGHGYKVPTQFTPQQFDTIANMFKIFTVEKRHAYNSYGGNPSTERAARATADSIKARNPNVKVLLYWNSVMNYSTLYESNIEFNEHPEWVYTVWNTGYEIYDLTNPDCQDWWVNSIVNTIKGSKLDGVFLDAGPKVDVLGLTEAYNQAVDRVRDSLGPDKIIIYNGFRVNGPNSIQAGQDFIDHQSGVYIEFFLRTPCDTKEEVAFLFDNLIEAYEKGKIIIPRGTPLHYLEGAEDPLLFNFASFLLFYGPNSYYCYNLNGYSVDDGMFSYFPEYYDIATGKSLSGPKRDGYVYTREFENILVEVDLENVTAKIIHKNNNITQNPYNGVAAPIPGIIEAENYDVGGEGIAYHDVDSINKLGEYRNDGVDIEITGDISGDYNLGYVESGEWLEYTVNVESSDKYDFSFRTAAKSKKGKISLFIDNQKVGSVALPITSAWQTYTTTTLYGIYLTEGQHVLRLEIDSGGININYIKVSKSDNTTSIKRVCPIRENLIKIYPNPVINKIFVSSILNGEIILYDIRGNDIMKLRKNTGIDISFLKRGLYFIAIKQGNKNIAIKPFYKIK